MSSKQTDCSATTGVCLILRELSEALDAYMKTPQVPGFAWRRAEQRLRDARAAAHELLDEAADMLDAYAEAIKATGDFERWHYIPEVEHVAQQLRASAGGAA